MKNGKDAMQKHSLDWKYTTTSISLPNHEGILSFTTEKAYPNMRFYDEREWRFVPRTDDPAKVFMVSQINL